jgi:UDP-glucuronate decarboxylase
MNQNNSVITDDLSFIHARLGAESNKFENATILMTGCGGFLGFYMLQYLVKYAENLKINKIIGLDNFIIEKPEWLAHLEKNNNKVLSIHNFDIAFDDMSKIELSAEVNFVIHAASIASPTFYRKFPLETVDANIWGLRKLLDYYNSDALKGFLFFSSSEIYGDPPGDQIPTGEEYRGNVSCAGPRACYDESKRFGETLCWIYAETHNLPITIARPFNNFGPGMKLGDKRLPADFANAVINGRDIEILSDGKPTRTFCYVADAVVGYFLCLLYGKYDYFNIGTEKPEISVKDTAKLYVNAAKDILGTDLRVSYQKSDDSEYLVDNPNRRSPKIDKARNRLGYDPVIGVEEGIYRYIKFLSQETL